MVCKPGGRSGYAGASGKYISKSQSAIICPIIPLSLLIQKNKNYGSNNWLVDTIQRYRRISLKDLSRIWQDNDSLNPEGCELTDRTFHRHREEIERIFGISIKCDKRDMNRYYIDEDGDVEGSKVRLWMLSTIAIDNMLNQNRDLRGLTRKRENKKGRQKRRGNLCMSMMTKGMLSNQDIP